MAKRRTGRITFEDLDPELSEIDATTAKNTFGSVLREILRGTKYQINRNGSPVAVIVNFERFNELVRGVGEEVPQEIIEALKTVTATDAKNKFGGVLDDVLGGGRIAVRRNSRLQGVILDYNDYHRLWRKIHAAAGDDGDGDGRAAAENGASADPPGDT